MSTDCPVNIWLLASYVKYPQDVNRVLYISFNLLWTRHKRHDPSFPTQKDYSNSPSIYVKYKSFLWSIFWFCKEDTQQGSIIHPCDTVSFISQLLVHATNNSEILSRSVFMNGCYIMLSQNKVACLDRRMWTFKFRTTRATCNSASVFIDILSIAIGCQCLSGRRVCLLLYCSL